MRKSLIGLSLLAAASLVWSVGCGTSSGGSSAGDRAHGAIRISIKWPVRSKVIPTAASSIKITISETGIATQSQLVARPAGAGPFTSLATFNNLAVGQANVSAVAYPNADGSGNAQGAGAAAVSVQPNTTTQQTVTMASTITQIVIIGGSNQSGTVGTPLTLTASALDANGSMVVTGTTDWKWHGSTGLQVTPNGSSAVVLASSPGTDQVTATETDSNVTSAPVNLVESASSPGLASSAWPKEGADVQNTGRGIAAGSTGTTKSVQYTAGGRIYSSPAIGGDGTIYFGSGDNYLYALSAAGALKWKTLLGNEAQSGPVLSGDGNLYVGTQEGRLYSISTAGGAINWTYPAQGQPAVGAIHWTPTLATDGTIYFGSADHYVYAVTHAGALKWRFQTGNQVKGGAALGPDGTVYIGSTDGKLYSINPTTGAQNWAYTANNQIVAAPSFSTTTSDIYVGSLDGFLYAIHSSNGGLDWSVQIGQIEDTPAISADSSVVYVGSDDFALYAVYTGQDGTHKGGTVAWSQATKDVITCSPSIASDGTVYAAGDDHFLYAFHPDGTAAWANPVVTGDQDTSSPAISADGTIYVGTDSPDTGEANTTGLPNTLYGIK